METSEEPMQGIGSITVETRTAASERVLETVMDILVGQPTEEPEESEAA